MRWWWSKPREKLYWHTEWTEHTLNEISEKLDAVREKLNRRKEEHNKSINSEDEIVHEGKCVRCHLRPQSGEGIDDYKYLCEHCQIHGGPARSNMHSLREQIKWCKGEYD